MKTYFVKMVGFISFTLIGVSMNSPESVYYGCFTDDPDDRILSGRVEIDSSKNSVTYCISFCDDENYAFAGVEFGIECYCGNDFVFQVDTEADNEAETDDGDESNDDDEGGVTPDPCGYTCPGNSSENCGGDNMIAVYGIDGRENSTIQTSTETTMNSVQNSTDAVQTFTTTSSTHDIETFTTQDSKLITNTTQSIQDTHTETTVFMTNAVQTTSDDQFVTSDAQSVSDSGNTSGVTSETTNFRDTTVIDYNTTGTLFTSTMSGLNSVKTTIQPILSTSEDTEEANLDNFTCICPCANISHVLDSLKKIISELSINKKNTNSYQRKLSSAMDNRWSSRAIGGLGIFCILIPFVLFILIDFLNYSKHLTGSGHYYFNTEKKIKY